MVRVLMVPHLRRFRTEESGIRRVVEAYFRHLPKYDVHLVDPGQPHDVKAAHAGIHTDCDVAHCHGLYWTADYSASRWEWSVNAEVIESVRNARIVTVPSGWVAESFRRDMRFSPRVIGHGVEWDEWAEPGGPGEWVLWNKNRAGDVCDPTPVYELARARRGTHFVTTFGVKGQERPHNVNVIGSTIPYGEMKKLVQGCLVYMATTKETFGIGILEAMASGRPVLAYAHGGVLELVEHGVHGYLAEPGNAEDLAEGLDYCIRHAATLGANGREAARAFTWDAVCEKVAGVYKEAAEPEEEPTVSVIIPSYNYAANVGRAIESALAQDYPNLVSVVVVDDGSPDDGKTEAVVKVWQEKDVRVGYIRQDNSGVAVARNRGIFETATKYVCCLDADDAIAPEFLSTCVLALEAERSLGIAYTGLWFVKADGSEGLSRWPPDCNFDEQVAGKNQVPTCCVFRREMWERLGGYRRRYCPHGAGEEDAEFWLRAGAYGWGARKVTDKGLFVYSWESGRVSGDRGHAASDWRAWHPWVKDGLHPFASAATPKQGMSHPVRQYDEPLVSVVIPVGPGHEDLVVDALDSLEAQTFRRWEAVVVWDSDAVKAIGGGKGAVDVAVSAKAQALMKAYPYVAWKATPGGKGAGYARNLGASAARAPFLLFLDADDYLAPEALGKMLDEWDAAGPCVVYSDYYGKAFLGDVGQLAPDLQQRIVATDEVTGVSVLEYVAFDYDCGRAQGQPVGDGSKPYVWCNVTSMVPRAWFEEVGGFDEGMESWEDWDLWLRLARRGVCFRRIAEPLLTYRFYGGARREIGRELRKDLVEYLQRKYEKEPIEMCRDCSDNKRGGTSPHRAVPGAMAARTPGRGIIPTSVPDDDFIMCLYLHPNKGNHHVYGAVVFDSVIEGVNMVRAKGGGFKFYYGHHGGGETFLVHRRDSDQQPHLFQPAQQTVPLPASQRETPPPSPLGPPAVPVPGQRSRVEPDEVSPLEAVREVYRESDGEVVDEGESVADDFQKLPGVTNAIAQQLYNMGLSMFAEVAALSVDELKTVKGVADTKAAMIREAARKRARDG